MRVRKLLIALIAGVMFGAAIPAVASTSHFNLTNIWGDDTFKIDGCRSWPFDPAQNGSNFYYRAKEAAAEISGVVGSGLDYVYTTPQPCVSNGAANTGDAGVPDDNTWIGDYWSSAFAWNWTSSTPQSGQLLGEASIYTSGSDVRRAWIKINDDNDIPWNTSNSAIGGQYDLEGVQLHELGHTAGFGHFGCPNDTMCNNPDEFESTKKMSTLSDHEKSDLAAKY